MNSHYAISEAPLSSDGSEGSPYIMLLSSAMDLQLGLAVAVPVAAVTDAVNATLSLSTNSTTVNACIDQVALSDGVVIVLRAIAADSMAMTGALGVVLYKLEQIVETLLLAGAATSRIDALVQITEALLLEDLARTGFNVEASSSADAATTIATQAQMIAAAVSTAAAAASLSTSIRITALVSDDMDVQLTLSTNMQMFEALADGLNASLVLRIGDDEYTAYALSLNRQLRDGAPVAGVVEYQNFPFNSFAKHDGRYFGASEHGVFELTGDTDNGAEIDAWVRTALNNFGVGNLKRMPSVYLGYTSSGTMVVKTVTTTDGAKVEDWYVMREKPADAMRDGRTKIGRGLKSVYWAWELHNVDGADFAIDRIELMPLVLSRRIKDGN